MDVALVVSGSVAAYKACELARRLQENGYDVHPLMTKAAQQFVSPLTLGSICGRKVLTDMFDAAQDPWRMPHIALSQKIKAAIIAPATAHMIGKLANGLADDIITCMILATRVPVIIAPAMNVLMYDHPIVQDNCARLKGFGMHFVEPVEGKLACGMSGKGHIATEADIVTELQRLCGGET